MKKVEVSMPDLLSNTLALLAAAFVVTSVLLGDNLVLVAGRLTREFSMIMDLGADYLAHLVS